MIKKKNRYYFDLVGYGCDYAEPAGTFIYVSDVLPTSAMIAEEITKKRSGNYVPFLNGFQHEKNEPKVKKFSVEYYITNIRKV